MSPFRLSDDFAGSGIRWMATDDPEVMRQVHSFRLSFNKKNYDSCGGKQKDWPGPILPAVCDEAQLYRLAPHGTMITPLLFDATGIMLESKNNPRAIIGRGFSNQTLKV